MRRGVGVAGFLATIAAVLIALACASTAAAIDAAEGLSGAEERITGAEAQIAGTEARLAPARRRYAATTQRANRAERKAGRAASRAEEVEDSLAERREATAARVASIDARYNEAVDEHDSEVESAWGLALAALAATLIALAWGRFRDSAPVTKLGDLSRGEAIALCAGGGVAMLILGASLGGAGGLLTAVGLAIMLLGLILPVALLLARHSVAVQRGKERAVLKQDRLPAWVSLGLAILMLLLFAGSLGSAIFSDTPEKPAIAASVRAEAEYAEDDDPAEPATVELRKAAARAENLEALAAKLADPRDEARRVLSEIRAQLRAGKRLLVQAQRDARAFTRRLAAIAEREALEAEEARELEEIEEEELPPVASEGYESCDTAPSNIPVPPGSPLDGDGDGIGCES